MVFDLLKQRRWSPHEIAAIERLQNAEKFPGLAPWDGAHTRVTLVSAPAFYPYSVWVLQERDSVYEVRRIEWDHVSDFQTIQQVKHDPKLTIDVPTTFGADALVPTVMARQILADLAMISLPPFQPIHTLGTDGAIFGFLFGNIWRSACLSWWGEGPEEWKDLAGWYHHAVGVFETFLPQSTSRIPMERRRKSIDAS